MISHIKGVAIDTKDLDSGLYDLILKSPPEYIYTEISYNTDFLLRGTSKKVVTTLKSLSEWKTLLEWHRKTIGIDHFEILLFSHPGPEIVEIKKTYSQRFNYLGLKNPEIKDIQEYKRLTGYFPDYVMLRINPQYYKKDVIDFCQASKIQIISEGVIGSQDMARSYSFEFLLAFASYNSDIVLIPTEYGYEKVLFFNSLLTSLKKRPAAFESEDLFKPEENITSEYLGDTRQIISLYLRANNSVVNLGKPGNQVIIEPDLIFIKGTRDYEFIDPSPGQTRAEQEVHKELAGLEGLNLIDEGEVQALGRYVAVSKILSAYVGESKWVKLRYQKIGNMFVMYLQHKLWWWKKAVFALSIKRHGAEYRIFFIEKRT